jgi:nuclear pore complex protein Nup155
MLKVTFHLLLVPWLMYCMLGAVNLPLSCAEAQDPDNSALECWHAGTASNDPRQEQLQRRLKCYDLILDSLTVFEEKCSQKQASATAGIPALDDPETVRSHAYELAFSSEDEMFHSTLYDWLISRNLADDLLEVKTVTLSFHYVRLTFF